METQSLQRCARFLHGRASIINIVPIGNPHRANSAFDEAVKRRRVWRKPSGEAPIFRKEVIGCWRKTILTCHHHVHGGHGGAGVAAVSGIDVLLAGKKARRREAETAGAMLACGWRKSKKRRRPVAIPRLSWSAASAKSLSLFDDA